MLLNSHTFSKRCSDVDSESDNFSVDSLDNETVSSIHNKNSKEPAYKIKCLQPEYEVNKSLNKSSNKSLDLNLNYGYDKSNECELPFDSGIEQFIEAKLSKVNITLPGEPFSNEIVKTKFEKKTVRKVCQHKRAKSVSSPKNGEEYNQVSRKEIVQFKSQVSRNYLPRSLSSDSASLQVHTSHRSPVRKTVAKLTPTKRSTSYLAQYRGQNPHYQAQGSEDNHDMEESPSQVSDISSQDDESKLYSDIINGKINEWGQSECEDNSAEHELMSASVQDLKSVSEIRCDSNHSNSYVPYTVKDRLLVLPTKLGSLGPDPSSYREKAESCKKRQQYGTFASLKNMEMIRQRNLKKMISEALTDLHESTSQDDILADEVWECCSDTRSSSSSKVEDHRDDVSTSFERSKKQPKYGCGKFKKKLTPTEKEQSFKKKINDVKTESNLDMINKLLRDRNKNEVIINHF